MPNLAHYKQLSDQELLKHCTIGQDKQCLGILLQRYTLLLLGVCLKYLKNEEEAKDAVQQVFSKAITEVGKYPIDHFKSWLYIIARNHCLMELRHKIKPLPEEAIDKAGAWLATIPNESKPPWQEKEEKLLWLEEGLHQLQPAQQQCVSLFYLDKKSYQQISEATGYSLLQVKSYIQNGKRNIRLWMEKKMNEHGS